MLLTHFIMYTEELHFKLLINYLCIMKTCEDIIIWLRLRSLYLQNFNRDFELKARDFLLYVFL